MQDNIVAVRGRLESALQKAGRAPGSASLLAVSKKKPIEDVQAAYEAGQRAFGENYLQEALDKQQALSTLDIEWHFIGALQSNKTREIAEHFDWCHTVDRLKIARRLSEQRPSHLPPLNICLQVNISRQASKSGAAPEEVEALAAEIASLPGLAFRGLMAIPAPTMPILEGLDGVQKMSKSLGNYIGINDRPGEMFNKLVSMPDSLMWRYFELLSLKSMGEVRALMDGVERGANPRDVKMELARELVTRFHGEEAAANAHKSSGNQLAEGEVPEDLEDITLVLDMEEAPIAMVLNQAGLANNGAQARDMLKNQRVWIDGEKVTAATMLAVDGQPRVFQAGKKRYARITMTRG